MSWILHKGDSFGTSSSRRDASQASQVRLNRILLTHGRSRKVSSVAHHFTFPLVLTDQRPGSGVVALTPASPSVESSSSSCSLFSRTKLDEDFTYRFTAAFCSSLYASQSSLLFSFLSTECPGIHVCSSSNRLRQGCLISSGNWLKCCSCSKGRYTSGALGSRGGRRQQQTLLIG